MCRIDGAQCCTDEYLEEVKENVRDRLEDYLGEEFQDVIEEYEDEIEDLLECEFPMYLLSVDCLYRKTVFSDIQITKHVGILVVL